MICTVNVMKDLNHSKKSGKTGRTAPKENEETEKHMFYKTNAYENILKARNSKSVSIPGIREHLVVYLSSDKARNTTHIFSKAGGKGTRPVLEQILTNSLEKCKFVEPKN